MFVYPPLPSYFLSFLLIIFFMLALLRRISFLTTIYGLYYSHNYTHFANLNFLHAGPLWAALKYCIYTLLSDLWVLSMFRLSFRFLSYTIRLINTYYCYYYQILLCVKIYTKDGVKKDGQHQKNCQQNILPDTHLQFQLKY